MADSDTVQQVEATTANNQRRAALQAEIMAIYESNPRGAAIEAEIKALLRAREPLKKAIAEFMALCENNQRALANSPLAYEPLKKAMDEIMALRENNQRARAIFKNNQRGAAIEAEIGAILRAREGLEKAIAEFKAANEKNQRDNTPFMAAAFLVGGFIAGLLF